MLREGVGTVYWGFAKHLWNSTAPLGRNSAQWPAVLYCTVHQPGDASSFELPNSSPNAKVVKKLSPRSGVCMHCKTKVQTKVCYNFLTWCPLL